ncbi:MAG: acyl-CoA reductase [Clostridia bacterium]|jgi:hypothetical protein|nr:acyl-CoA reductase [Clostridia bacterium]
MNLVDGKILDTKDCDSVLESLDERILETLAKPPLTPKVVINACDKLVNTLDKSLYSSALAQAGIPEELADSYLAMARGMFSGEALRFRLKKEFGQDYDKVLKYTPVGGENEVTERILPLGVLLHIAAGNADGLPAFSVLEGLLTGNINILKLPAAEGGISIRLLYELIQIEPLLSEYIYVFDYSSQDIVHINKLIDAADAVVVWGGTGSVSAFRGMLPPHIKLIEWGHKVSFAYVTKDGREDGKLAGIAKNMAHTSQLLCSSCQGIFLDTDDTREIDDFCRRFLPILEEAVAASAKPTDIGIKAQTALRVYSSELEKIYTGDRLFKGNGCSLRACNNQIPEAAIGFANAWIKPLPCRQILKALRPYKNYLQTIALLCGEHEKDSLIADLLKTGAVRVCPGGRMSETYSGAPHDGEYPLRRYTKIASWE